MSAFVAFLRVFCCFVGRFVFCLRSQLLLPPVLCCRYCCYHLPYRFSVVIIALFKNFTNPHAFIHSLTHTRTRKHWQFCVFDDKPVIGSSPSDFCQTFDFHSRESSTLTKSMAFHYLNKLNITMLHSHQYVHDVYLHTNNVCVCRPIVCRYTTRAL